VIEFINVYLENEKMMNGLNIEVEDGWCNNILTVFLEWRWRWWSIEVSRMVVCYLIGGLEWMKGGRSKWSWILLWRIMVRWFGGRRMGLHDLLEMVQRSKPHPSPLVCFWCSIWRSMSCHGHDEWIKEKWIVA